MKRIMLPFIFVAIALFPISAQAPLPSTASVDIGFSPGGTALAVVEKAIDAAHSEILMACYEFTSIEITKALEAAAQRNVKVCVVVDWKASHDKYSEIEALVRAGIPVRLDQHYAIFHHKFMIIDEADLETGSFNFTEAAIKHNAENAIVLWNVPEVANAYAREWRRLWEESTPAE
jgi:phosphatidylserine/phosphatidylglycerophosphate/cardiolipin synthase-like enzyme